MQKAYTKITEYDVYRLLFGLEIDPMVASVGYWLTTKCIASLLNTSYYQANKYLKVLSDQGAVEKVAFQDNCNCYEFCECDSTGRWYKCWVFKARLEKYKEQDDKQEQKTKKIWDDFVEGRLQ